MKRYRKIFVFFSFCLCCVACLHNVNVAVLPYASIQDTSGIQLGVSAMFTGYISDKLIFIGGSNFPHIPAAEGGKKHYYNSIYTQTFGDNTWQKSGVLPKGIAYGASAVFNNALYCIGGISEDGLEKDVFRISFLCDSLCIEKMPSLPEGRSNASAAVVGNYLYLVGGTTKNGDTNSLLTLDLQNTEEGWIEKTDFPGNKRIQTISISQKLHGKDALFVLGGFSTASECGSQPTVSLSPLCYLPQQNQWITLPTPINENGEVVCLGGGIGMALQNKYIVCTGGVNKDIFMHALQREQLQKEAFIQNNTFLSDSLKIAGKLYMLQSPEWYKFNDLLFLYNIQDNEWKIIGKFQEGAKAGAGLISVPNGFILCNGEIKPGIRTPFNWYYKFQ